MKTTHSGIVRAIIIVAILLASSIGHTQVPRLFSYQGLMLGKNLQPVTGDHIIEVKYYNAMPAGTPLLDEMHGHVTFHDGIFDLVLGGLSSGFPYSIRFDDALWIELTLDPGSSTEQIFPRQELLSAPYALNAERVNGFTVTNFPVNGAIWPVPIGGDGRIAASILPAPDQPSITSIGTVGSNASGDLGLIGANGITITPNASRHSFTIENSRPPGIDTLITPLTGGVGGPGNTVVLLVGAPQITNSAFAAGTITDGNFALGSITPSRFAPNTSATMVAVGTTAQRPATPAQGIIRFNTDTGRFEGYDGTAWVNLN